jgi:hypothetical protein
MLGSNSFSRKPPATSQQNNSTRLGVCRLIMDERHLWTVSGVLSRSPEDSSSKFTCNVTPQKLAFVQHRQGIQYPVTSIRGATGKQDQTCSTRSSPHTIGLTAWL